MIKIFNKLYYIDFTEISNLIAGEEEFKTGEQKEMETVKHFDRDGKSGKPMSTEITERVFRKERQYDVAKYEVLSLMIQVVMNNQEEIDDMMGIDNALKNQSFPFKLAFNTLLFYKIIKEL